MAVKILIQRRIKPGKERELNQAVKQLRSKAVHSPGFISGETLRSVEDPLVHLVICTWKSLEDWSAWVHTAERKGFEEEIKGILAQPEKITPYQYE
jgi:heme-degrading monooxygenase HmoA